MFQSSWTSWSSKIIAVETVDSSQRIVGSPQLSRYSCGVLLEVDHALAGRVRASRACVSMKERVAGDTSSA